MGGLLVISNYEKSKVQSFAIIFVLGLYIILLSLPIVRGYFISDRYDVMVHIGKTKDVLYHGHISRSNFYPAMHILAGQIANVVGTNVYATSMYLPVIIYSLFAPFVYIVAKHLNAKNKWYPYVVTFLSILYVPRPFLVPSVVSYILAILVLGIWLSSIDYTKKVMLILVLYISIVFMHPLTSIYLSIILILIDIVCLIFPEDSIRWNFEFYRLLPAIIIIWTLWYTSFYSILINFRSVVLSFIGESGNIYTEHYAKIVEFYALSFLDLMPIIIIRYGKELLLILLGISAFLVFSLHSSLLKSKLEQKTILSTIFLLNIWFASFLIWYIISNFIHFVHPTRIFKYTSLFSILLVPFFATYYFTERPLRYSKSLFGAIVISLVMLSVFSMYPSPLGKAENRQVTKSEFTSWGFLFEHRLETITIKNDIKTTQMRFYVAWYGESSLLTSKNILRFNDQNSRIPAHFGYSNIPSVGYQYREPTYYVVSKIVKLLYPRILPNKEEKWSWCPKDFVRLESDPTVNTIYRTRDISIYFVLPKT